MIDVVDLTQKLISCPSVTPKDEGAQEILNAHLSDAGFTCHSLPFGEGEKRIENLFARIGTASGEGTPHLCYGGHTDVVPPGALDQWSNAPFTPTITDGVLYGRGASDMKGSVAAFACAAMDYVTKYGAPENGSISLLITGDEEAEAINGTIKVLEWMDQNGHRPDMAIVGEPTNPDHMGQEIKIGRRGSISGYLSLKGAQGHVAYPHLSDNPVPRMIKLLDILASYEFDKGNDYFTPTNLEITSIDVGNPVTNIIPEQVTASFNIRFNDTWSNESLKTKIVELLDATDFEYTLTFEGNAESFITQPSAFSDLVASAVEKVSGKRPAYTTTGGTSDARFIVNYCPVIECGAVNKTIHQIDENARVTDLEDLYAVYFEILKSVFQH